MNRLDRVVEELQEAGKDAFRVICRQSVDYDWGREISNSRINKMPLAIVLPKDAQQVASCVKICVAAGVPFRVRSGGHHHEGMSSLDDGVVIRLSEINRIEYLDGKDREGLARIGVGKPLEDVYNELEQSRRMTIPGGGCQTVNVGGLTLGGGWGTSVRKMGLTCDNFEEAEMVTAEGEVIRVRADNDYNDLFWSLRGGGGGNFGIVTRFLFRLTKIGPHVSTFTMQWTERSEEEMVAIVQDYLNKQANFPLALSTTMGLRVKHKFMKEYYPIGLAGKFYGPVEELQALLEPFQAEHRPSYVKFEEKRFSDGTEKHSSRRKATLGSTSEEDSPQLAALINSLVDFIHLGGPASGHIERKPSTDQPSYQEAPPDITCSDPWPHKISSAFPAGRDRYPEIARRAVRIILETNERLTDNAARLYMVFHGMPGYLKDKNPAAGTTTNAPLDPRKISPTDTAFYWREKEFILQFQAWWAKPAEADRHPYAEGYEREQDRYIAWIGDARRKIDGQRNGGGNLEGAFINFVDRNIPVEEYYGRNFERLREVKSKYDPNCVFQFPLSIPPAEA